MVGRGALVLTQLLPLPTVPLPPPYHLQEVEVPIVGNRECNHRYQNLDSTDQVIKGDMLCAGSEGQDSCQVRPQAALATSSVPFQPRRMGLACPLAMGTREALAEGLLSPQMDSGGPLVCR